MDKSTFLYVSYIRSTPEKVFEALTRPEVTRQYWDHENESDWKPGSPWKHVDRKGGKGTRIVGKVLEYKPPARLVVSWASPADEANATKHSRVSYDIEWVVDMVRLTVTHEDLETGSEMERGIRNGWPRVLSSLKSFLETGKALDVWAGMNKCAA